MAVRNGEATVEHAIRSISRQSFADWELIVIDDGSTDETTDIVRKMADKRMRLFRNEQSLGLAASLNKALSEAKGYFIARMDADDISFPYRLERQLYFLKHHPEVDLVGGQALMFRGDWDLVGTLNAPLDHGEITRSPSSRFPLFHPCWMGKAAWFARYKYNDRYLRAQDFEILLRALPNSRYANIADVILGYRYERQGLAKRRASRKFQRLAVAENRASLPTNYARAMSGLWIKEFADFVFSSAGLELAGVRTMPSPAVARQWFDLVGSLE